MKLKYLVLSLLFVSKAVCAADNVIKHTPENTVIAFDLNDVLVEKNIKSMTWQSACLLANPYTWQYILNPYFWSKAKEYAKNTKAKGTIFTDKLVKDYPGLEYYKPTFISISSSHVVNPIALATVVNLKQQGYKIFIFSNMENETMTEVSKNNPQLFTNIDGYFCPPADGSDFKPNLSFYESFKGYLKSQDALKEHTVFVDDKPENITAAQQAGFIGIVCDNIHNVFKKFDEMGLVK